MFRPDDTEFCISEDAGWTSFNQFVKYDWRMVQMMAIAMLSTFFNVFVLWYHLSIPPHPKHLLLTKRKICLRLHVFFGTVEILFFLLAWFVPMPRHGLDLLVHINMIASFIHILTSLYQFPLVFGIRAIMLPAYFLCIFGKALCLVDLYLHPYCALKFLRLYNIHSVYTWVRVFTYIFWRFHILEQNAYTVAVLLAGFTCYPSGGIVVNIANVVLITGFATFVKFCTSAEVSATMFEEDSRDMFSNSIGGSSIVSLANTGDPFSRHLNRSRAASRSDDIDAPLSRTISREDSSVWGACPFALHTQQDTILEALFDSMRNGDSNVVTFDELERFVKNHPSRGFTALLELYRKRSKNSKEQGMDSVTFKRFFGGSQRRRVALLDSESAAHAASPEATYEEQARFVFEFMNASGGDSISMEDLAFALLPFGLPMSDVEEIMMTCDADKSGDLSFDEFKRGMAPLVVYQIRSLFYIVESSNAIRERSDTRSVAMAEKASDASTMLSERYSSRPVLEDEPFNLCRA